MAQSNKPSLTVLGGLLLLAAVVAIALWMSVQFGTDAGDGTAPSTVLPPGAEPAPGDEAAPAAPGLPTAEQAATGTIATIQAYDPDGDNGDENDDEAIQALADGDPNTNWRTECYGGEFMGGKFGVGLVVSLDGPAQRGVSVEVVNAPYIVEFYTSTAETVPATFDAWESQLGGREFATESQVVVSDVTAEPVRHILVALRQLGLDSGCTERNPYRGRLGEISLVG